MSNLQVVKTQDDRKALRQRERRIKRRRRKELLTYIILIAMAICGTYLLLDRKTYGTVRKADSYAKDLSDRNNYVQFADGIVRYNHDGVVFLNKKNEDVCFSPSATTFILFWRDFILLKLFIIETPITIRTSTRHVLIPYIRLPVLLSLF